MEVAYTAYTTYTAYTAQRVACDCVSILLYGFKKRCRNMAI